MNTVGDFIKKETLAKHCVILHLGSVKMSSRLVNSVVSVVLFTCLQIQFADLNRGYER